MSRAKNRKPFEGSLRRQNCKLTFLLQRPESWSRLNKGGWVLIRHNFLVFFQLLFCGIFQVTRESMQWLFCVLHWETRIFEAEKGIRMLVLLAVLIVSKTIEQEDYCRIENCIGGQQKPIPRTIKRRRNDASLKSSCSVTTSLKTWELKQSLHSFGQLIH